MPRRVSHRVMAIIGIVTDCSETMTDHLRKFESLLSCELRYMRIRERRR